MTIVKAKKHLGQHFLKDRQIAAKIVNSLRQEQLREVLEIGPGTGVLTRLLLERPGYGTTVIEIDGESVDYLKTRFPRLKGQIIQGDFLRMKLSEYFHGPFAVIGNFPYNISSQIFFHLLDYRDQIREIVCMLQKEVAERLSAGPGSKAYGILSVILQTYYDIEYLFTVSEHAFLPPPRVQSAVIRLNRNNRLKPDCDETLYLRLIKTAFNQRRKTLRNSLRSFLPDETLRGMPVFSKRPEQLGVVEFESLTRLICSRKNQSSYEG
ncbi:MAG: 16S rRNA (adenine(1518)-N(6)/adenine(1519)-N(6))-dimethyltransferase RsmA [Mangrovibacterium sp.]